MIVFDATLELVDATCHHTNPNPNPNQPKILSILHDRLG
jgi:hypothetical protein